MMQNIRSVSYTQLDVYKRQDLNWYNKEVLDELYKMINWWLDKGVSGFRIDAIINIAKDLNFENLEPDGEDGLVPVSYTHLDVYKRQQ